MPTQLPTIDIGRKEATKDKNTESKEVAYNKDAQVEGGVTVLVYRGPQGMRNPKQWADDKAQIEANRLGRTVKVKLKIPKNQSGGGGGGSPRDPGANSNTLDKASQFLGRSEANSQRDLQSFIGQNSGIPINIVQTPWCAAFANGVLGSLGYPVTRSLAAKSFTNYGDRVWSRGGGGSLNDVRPGDIAVFNRGSKGHVGFVKSIDGDRITIVGGNQGDKYSGGQVSTATRNINSPGNELIAVRRAPGSGSGANPLSGGGGGQNGQAQGGQGGGGGQGGQGGDQEETIESKEAKPDGRDDDINKRAVKKDEGDTEEAKKLREPPTEKSKRGQKGFTSSTEGVLGIKSEDNEGTEQGSESGDSFQKDQLSDFKGGVPREFGAQIPPMESILMSLPNSAINQFVGQLPGPLQGLIPPGLVNGISGTSPVGLNNLMQLVGGGALSQMAGQMLRSTSSGLALPGNISGLTGITPSQALGTQQLPGTNNTAIAGVLGAVTKVSTNRRAAGIPVDLSSLTRSIQLVLRSAGAGVAIPTNVFGIASTVAAAGIGQVINQLLGGMLGGGSLPLLPSNLSLPNSAIISGLGQVLPPGIAQNVLGIGQLTGLLPPSLQNQIPSIPAAANNGAPNFIEQARNASPQLAPEPGSGGAGGMGDQAGGTSGGGSSPQEKEAIAKGNSKGGRYVDYNQKISKYLTLAQVTTHVLICPGQHWLRPHMGLSVDELIENLSLVAVNCYDPIYERWKPVTVNSGFRENSSTDHGRGKALDLSFSGSHAQLFEIAKWARDNVPFKQIILERQKSSWLHIAFGKGGQKSRTPVMTQIPGTSGANSRFSPGLINYYGNR